uniref:Uncharacterized protein n=1 Tax=Daphnia galeata TaxID=27404 RepID=A0A8J2R9M8_9CRUS|nr:unnamed protein product [Daphnia galeata]
MLLYKRTGAIGRRSRGRANQTGSTRLPSVPYLELNGRTVDDGAATTTARSEEEEGKRTGNRRLNVTCLQQHYWTSKRILTRECSTWNESVQGTSKVNKMHEVNAQSARCRLLWTLYGSNGQTGGWLNDKTKQLVATDCGKNCSILCENLVNPAAKKLLCLYAFPEWSPGRRWILPESYPCATRSYGKRGNCFASTTGLSWRATNSEVSIWDRGGHFRLPKCEKTTQDRITELFQCLGSHSGSKYGQDPPSCSRGPFDSVGSS